MAHVFLWIESLVAGLLLVSTLLAAIVKASSWLGRPRLWQLLLSPLFALLLVCVPVGLTVFAGVLKFSQRVPGVPFGPMVVWTGLFIMGTAVLLARGLRIRSEDRQPCARSWLLGRLSACFLVAAALTCLTYNSLENDVRIRMTQLRLEAGAKVLAMAPPRILDRDNAAPIYQEAGATSGQFLKGNRLDEIWSNDLRKLDLNNEMLIELINSSQPALRLLRRGASMPAARFDWDSSDPEQLLPEVQFLREGAEVLLLDAMLRIHKGDSAASAPTVATTAGRLGTMRRSKETSSFAYTEVENGRSDTVLDAGLNITTLQEDDVPDTERGIARPPVFQLQSHRPKQPIALNVSVLSALSVSLRPLELPCFSSGLSKTAISSRILLCNFPAAITMSECLR